MDPIDKCILLTCTTPQAGPAANSSPSVPSAQIFSWGFSPPKVSNRPIGPWSPSTSLGSSLYPIFLPRLHLHLHLWTERPPAPQNGRNTAPVLLPNTRTFQNQRRYHPLRSSAKHEFSRARWVVIVGERLGGRVLGGGRRDGGGK